MTDLTNTASTVPATHNLTGKPILRPERRLSFGGRWTLGTVTIHPCEELPGIRLEPPLAEYSARYDVLVPEGMSVRLTVERSLHRSPDLGPLAGWHPYALDELSLMDVAVSDPGLRRIAGLTGLRYLDLYGSAITDASGPMIGALSGLEWLSLSFTEVGTPCAASLVGLSDLIRLSLRGTRITDTALVALTELPNLVWLSVADTGVSLEGLTWLMRRAPQLRRLAVNGTAAEDDPWLGLMAAETGVELIRH